jgi:hypothetical protein
MILDPAKFKDTVDALMDDVIARVETLLDEGFVDEIDDALCELGLDPTSDDEDELGRHAQGGMLIATLIRARVGEALAAGNAQFAMEYALLEMQGW